VTSAFCHQKHAKYVLSMLMYEKLRIWYDLVSNIVCAYSAYLMIVNIITVST